MIKVLHVTGAMNRGGAEVMLMDLYRNIPVGIHFDFLINFRKKEGITIGDFDAEIKKKGGKIKHIASQWDLGPSHYAKKFREIIVAIGQPDIVHIHMNSKSGVVAWAAKKAGVRNVIVHSHANLKFRGSLRSRIFASCELFIQKILIQQYADSFWGCSVEANQSLFYKRSLTAHNSKVINNAVDVSAFERVKDLEIQNLRVSYGNSTSVVLGNVGRVVRHKNVLFVIEVLKEMQQGGGDFIFVFAGRAEQRDYLDEILAKTKEYGLADRVIYLGLRDDIPLLMKSFDVFVGPALKEGFGLVAVEAQAAGIPAVLYTGFPRTVDMKLGLTVFLDSFDLNEWKQAIKVEVDKKVKDEKLIREKITSLGFDSKSNAELISILYNKMVS